MNPIDKAIEALAYCARDIHNRRPEDQADSMVAQKALRALRDMQEVDVEALKSKIGSELSYTIPHSYSDNTMLNTVDWISQNYNLIPKE